MKKIMIATPTTDGKLDAYYVDSLHQTISLGSRLGFFVYPVFVSYDALLVKARNDLFLFAYESNVDYVFWIDSDIGWNPEDFFKLINHDKRICGGTYRKKTDNEEIYVLRMKDNEDKLKIENGLIEVQGLGMGFACMDNYTIKKMWDNCVSYVENGKEKKSAFNIRIENQSIISEDICFCNDWVRLEEKIYLDPTVTCVHNGQKLYCGNFMDWLNRNNISSGIKDVMVNKN